MSDPDYLNIVIGLLKTNRCLNEKLDATTRLDQLEVDSMHLTRFLMDLEKEMRILVPDEVWVKWVSVADISDYVEKYKVEYGDGELQEM